MDIPIGKYPDKEGVCVSGVSKSDSILFVTNQKVNGYYVLVQKELISGERLKFFWEPEFERYINVYW